MTGPDPGRRARRILLTLGWGLAVFWTVFLFASDRRDDGNVFGLAVKVMGAAGILWLLFVVHRPHDRGILDFGRVRREELRAASEGLDAPAGASPEGWRRWTIVALVVALAVGTVAYRFTTDPFFHSGTVFFVGVPAVLALALSLTPRARSATGTIVKGLTLALLLSGVVFFEGFVCVLMASPLFYLIGVAIGVPIDRARRRRRSEPRVYSIVGLGMLLLMAEGVTPATTFPRVDTVTATRVVDASPAEVRAQLASTPAFDEELPLYLSLGFPRPVAASGAGLRRGDTRTIVFGDESPMEPVGMGVAGGHRHGAVSPEAAPSLDLVVVRRGPGLVAFEPTRDATAFTHWIDWGRSVVRWKPAGEGMTEITWTITFRRKLSPAWYFAPMQRYAAGLAAGYLIDTVAAP